jgi:hypothetical protein
MIKSRLGKYAPGGEDAAEEAGLLILRKEFMPNFTNFCFQGSKLF